jgi:hypothetical protein
MAYRGRFDTNPVRLGVFELGKVQPPSILSECRPDGAAQRCRIAACPRPEWSGSSAVHTYAYPTAASLSFWSFAEGLVTGACILMVEAVVLKMASHLLTYSFFFFIRVPSQVAASNNNQQPTVSDNPLNVSHTVSSENH